jgi:predicted neutral ceramidase superfamily lipid hydrolase
MSRCTQTPRSERRQENTASFHIYRRHTDFTLLSSIVMPQTLLHNIFGTCISHFRPMQLHIFMPHIALALRCSYCSTFLAGCLSLHALWHLTFNMAIKSEPFSAVVTQEFLLFCIVLNVNRAQAEGTRVQLG